MADQDRAGGDELLDDIYKPVEPLLEEKLSTDFKPWHKPRKHYIRLYQWCREARSLLKTSKPPEGYTVRYFGLPGADLVDVRLLKDICVESTVRLRYLGFDSSRNDELRLSEHEVNSAKIIDAESIITKDRVEDLASTGTIAFDYLKKHAPYDVINLDLCGSVTEANRAGVVPYLEALRNICDLQIGYQPREWVMFLTTRAIRDGLNAEVRQRLYAQLLKNATDHDSFATNLSQTLGFDKDAVERDVNGSEPLESTKWLKSYALGVSKWLITYMVNHNYKVKVQVLKGYGYAVYGDSPDMLSLAFRMVPPAREDETGLTKKRVQPDPVTELELALSAVEELAKIEDLDALLDADPKMDEKMLTKFAEILKALRYDVPAYHRWVEEQKKPHRAKARHA